MSQSTQTFDLDLEQFGCSYNITVYSISNLI